MAKLMEMKQTSSILFKRKLAKMRQQLKISRPLFLKFPLLMMVLLKFLSSLSQRMLLMLLLMNLLLLTVILTLAFGSGVIKMTIKFIIM